MIDEPIEGRILDDDEKIILKGGDETITLKGPDGRVSGRTPPTIDPVLKNMIDNDLRDRVRSFYTDRNLPNYFGGL